METNRADYAAIGRRIRATRKAQRLTQADMIDRVGLSASFIGHIERGTRIASVETILRFAEALGLSLDYMLTGTANGFDGLTFENIEEAAAQLRNALTRIENLSANNRERRMLPEEHRPDANLSSE